MFTFPYSNEWQTGSIPVEHIGSHDILKTAVIGSPYSPELYVGWSPVAVVPYWAVWPPIVAALVLSLWSLQVRNLQFSLKTILIVTAVVSLLLGLVVWLTR